MKAGKVHHEYNWFAIERTNVACPTPLAAGKHVIEYTLRLNSAGLFGLPPSCVEAMYAPDSFGELPNATLEVQP